MPLLISKFIGGSFMTNKVIRTICYFTANPSNETVERLYEISDQLVRKGYEIQTKRICSSKIGISELSERVSDDSILLSVGSLGHEKAASQLGDFYSNNNAFFNLDLTNISIQAEHVDILFKMIRQKPEKTFNFAYVFNNPPSSPYFPSATYAEEGFSIGLQPTNLSAYCDSLERWLFKIREVWKDIHRMFGKGEHFLGIDASIAPLFKGESSLIHFLRKIGYEFRDSVMTDIYLKITDCVEHQNPMPIGLCGLMLPCLEDFGLAEEYEKGNFSLERNIFLSLHSGLGVDTYPVGINEEPQKLLDILRLVQGLSNKYKKPLSIRFVSDGKAKIGDKTNLQNQYLKDVVVREL